MSVKQKTYSVQLVICLMAISWPLLYSVLKYQSREGEEDISYNKPNLTGLVISDEKPKFSFSDWLNSSYQTSADDYNNDHWAYKEKMVRLNNQFYYRLFNQIRVNGFVIGKDNYVFSESYIFSAFGDDLMKEEKIKVMLQKAKVLQDTLSKKGIDLLLVMLPVKVRHVKNLLKTSISTRLKTPIIAYLSQIVK
jgi:hypothetical protein